MTLLHQALAPEASLQLFSMGNRRNDSKEHVRTRETSISTWLYRINGGKVTYYRRCLAYICSRAVTIRRSVSIYRSVQGVKFLETFAVSENNLKWWRREAERDEDKTFKPIECFLCRFNQYWVLFYHFQAILRQVLLRRSILASINELQSQRTTSLQK